MDALAQRITLSHQSHEALREGLNDLDLQSEPRVLDIGGKRLALAQESAGARRKLVDASEQACGRAGRAQFVHAHAGFGKGVERNVDAIERSEEHTSELQSLRHLVCRLLLEKKKKKKTKHMRQKTHITTSTKKR